MPELITIRSYPVGRIERAGRKSAHSRRGFQCKAKITAALAAELDIEPPSGLVGDVAISIYFRTCDLHLIVIKHDLDPEGRSGSALAPSAMADCHAQRFSNGFEPHGVTNASSRIFNGHTGSSLCVRPKLK
jgi:hypothetical protein